MGVTFSHRLYLAVLLAAHFTFFAFCDTRAGEGAPFEDSWIRVELPNGWTIDGEGGEYMLESDDEDIGSLLVLSPDPERSIEEVLAEIEEQFLSTGLFALESAEQRDVDGEPVHVRRYKMSGGSVPDDDASVTIHHQYWFWRDEMHVLLQVETGGKSAAPERLFGKVFSTLTILEPPLPFLYEDYSEEESEDGFLPDDEEIRSLDEEDAAPEDSMSVENEDAGADSPDRSH